MTQRRHDHQDIDPAHVEDRDRDRLGQDVDVRVGVDAGAEDPPVRVLQEERGADGADERDEARGVPQRPVGDPLHAQREERGTAMATRTMATIENRLAIGLAFSSPAWASATAAKYPPNTPPVKMSPWAKLIMRRMP